MGNDTQDEGGISISVSDVQEKVAEKIKELDKQIAATQMIVAKIMSSDVKMVQSYSSVNQDIFKNQLNIDGGSLDDYYQRSYNDNRDIYAQVQNQYNDPVVSYQRNVEEAIENRIKAEEHLRRIRGY